MKINKVKIWGKSIRGAIKKLRTKDAFFRISVDRELTGACAIASYFLYKKLKRSGEKVKFVIGGYKGYTHCWIEYNEKIVDITATQFGIRSDVFIPKRKINYEEDLIEEEAFEDLDHWEEQSPYLYHGNWKGDKFEIRPNKIYKELFHDQELD